MSQWASLKVKQTRHLLNCQEVKCFSIQFGLAETHTKIMPLRMAYLVHGTFFPPLEVKCVTLQGQFYKIGKLEEFSRLSIADVIGTDFKLRK